MQPQTKIEAYNLFKEKLIIGQHFELLAQKATHRLLSMQVRCDGNL
jgi:hypothetical protein